MHSTTEISNYPLGYLNSSFQPPFIRAPSDPSKRFFVTAIPRKDFVQSAPCNVSQLFIDRHGKTMCATLENGRLVEVYLMDNLPPLKLLRESKIYFLLYQNSLGQLEATIKGRLPGGGHAESAARKPNQSRKEKEENRHYEPLLQGSDLDNLRCYFCTPDTSLANAEGKKEKVLNQNDFILVQSDILQHKKKFGHFEQGQFRISGEAFDPTVGKAYATPLLWVLGGYNPSCTLKARLIIAEMLLKEGADPNACGWNDFNATPVKNMSPLALVIKLYAKQESSHLVQMVSLLLHYEAKPKAVWIDYQSIKPKVKSVLELAKTLGRNDIVEILKRANKEGPKGIRWESPLAQIQGELSSEVKLRNDQSEHYASLLEAIQKGDSKTVEKLLEKQVPQYLNSHFEFALKARDETIFELLLQYGVDKIDSTTLNTIFFSKPPHPRQKSLIIKLVQAGFFSNTENINTYSPYFWSAHNGWDDVIEELDRAKISELKELNCISVLLNWAQHNQAQPKLESIKILSSRTNSKMWSIPTQLRKQYIEFLNPNLLLEGNVESFMQKILRNLHKASDLKEAGQEGNLKNAIFNALVNSDIGRFFGLDNSQAILIRQEIHDTILEQLNRILQLGNYFDAKTKYLNSNDIISELIDSLSTIEAKHKAKQAKEESEKKRDEEFKQTQEEKFRKIEEDQRSLANQIAHVEKERLALLADNERLTAESEKAVRRLKEELSAQISGREDDEAHAEFMASMAGYHGWNHY